MLGTIIATADVGSLETCVSGDHTLSACCCIFCLEEFRRHVSYPPVLPIEMDHVIAVVEPAQFPAAADVRCDIQGMRGATEIVFARMEDQGRCLDLGKSGFERPAKLMELEQTFLYLCLHDGGLLDMAG